MFYMTGSKINQTNRAKNMIDKVVGQTKAAALVALQSHIPKDVRVTDYKDLMRMLWAYSWNVSLDVH